MANWDLKLDYGCLLAGGNQVFYQYLSGKSLTIHAISPVL